MIRMYPDGVVEGTPEEVATFKHIDAALAARNARIHRALGPAKSPKPKKVKSSRPKAAQSLHAAIREWARETGRPVAPTGRIAHDVVDAFELAHRQIGA